MIGICAADRARSRWARLGGRSCNISPRTYSDAVQARRRPGAAAAARRRRRGRRPTTLLDLLDGCARRRRRRRPGAPTAPSRTRRRTGTWPERDRFELALAHRALERDMPAARHLPRACRCSTSPSAARSTSTSRRRRPRAPPRDARRSSRDHEVRLEPGSLAARAVGARARSPSSRTTTRASTGSARASVVTGLRRRRRPRRGDRAAGPRLRARRPLAPRGGRAQPRDRLARRGARERDGGRRPVIQVIEPATAEVMAEVPRAGVEEADAAVARARAAFPAWRAVDARATAPRCCTRLADALDAHREDAGRRSRRATPASRSPTPAARWRWSSTPSATTPARPSACSARRSRSPAAST